MGIARGPDIITKDLKFSIDAADERSYPGSGTTWFNLVDSINGTLTNGPTFNSGNGGSIVFDGTDDSVVFPYNSIFDMDTNSTIEVVFKCNSSLTDSTGNRQTIFSNIPSNSFGLEIGVFSGCSINSTDGFRFLMHRQGNCFSAVSQANAWTQSKICYFAYTRDASRNEKMYVDGNEITLQQANGYTYTSGTTSGFLGVRQGTSGGQKLNGNVYKMSFYSKALTSSEVKQNFNGIKNRFGL